MITCNEKESIVVEVNGQTYDLSSTEDYAKFVLWVTTPDADTVISAADFEVDESVADAVRPKAERYSEFLKSFAVKRSARLADEQTKIVPKEKREADIRALIDRLASRRS